MDRNILGAANKKDLSISIFIADEAELKEFLLNHSLED